MTTASIEVGYRPVRVGFLVREGVLDDVLIAARLSTLIWGGYGNLIVPVGDDMDAACEYLKQVEADVLHPIVEDSRLARVVDAFPYLRLPGEMRMRGILRATAVGELSLLDVRVLASHYYETLFVRPGAKSRTARPRWGSSDALAPLYTVMFGEYGVSDDDRFARAFRALGAEDVALAPQVPPTLAHSVTPITFTADQLRLSSMQRGDGLLLGDPRNPEHLATFWNLRAQGLGIAFWPLDNPDPVEAYCIESIGRLMPPQEGDPEPQPVYLWKCEDWGEEPRVPHKLSAAIAEAGGRAVLGRAKSHLAVRADRRSQVWATVPQSTLATVEDDRFGHRTMVFALPPAPYSHHRISEHELWDVHWLVTVSALGEYDYPGFTVRLPNLPELNPWASQALHPIREVRLSSSAVGLFLNPTATSVNLRLVEEAEVIRRVLELAGAHATVSPAGEAARRIIRQMDGLERCRPFRLPGVRALLGRGDATHAWMDAVRTIEDAGSYRRYKNVGTAADTFKSLIQRGVFQAGLHVRCPECRIRSRYSAESLAREITCPRCGSAFPLATRVESARWEYQASGFFAHHREHGAVPVILTMLRLEHDLRPRALFLTPSHRVVADDLDCEVDFLALLMHHDGSVEFAVGECKGGPEQLEANDVSNLSMLADRVRSLGIECHLVLSTTRDRFERDELELVRNRRTSAGPEESIVSASIRAPIMFTGIELRTFDRTSVPNWESAPRRYPHTLADLAANSEWRYLGDGAVVETEATEEGDLLI
jgi:hypothetical protein